MPLAKIYIFSNHVTAFLVEADGSTCELSLLQSTALHHLIYRTGLEDQETFEPHKCCSQWNNL